MPLRKICRPKKEYIIGGWGKLSVKELRKSHYSHTQLEWSTQAELDWQKYSMHR
jgi:hypothetical protein